ncbi:hypothetical protein AB0L33_04535 [Streptomyces sp. NPDC052299]|uniref:hypothetical protein n=1 Tax=Streptomyces sp. NPDC052299 TaxID=3155054 RepID=UPI0034483323
MHLLGVALVRAGQVFGAAASLLSALGEDARRRTALSSTCAPPVLWHHRELRLRARELRPVLQDADQAAGFVLPLCEALLSLLYEYREDLPLPDDRQPELRAFDLHEEANARGRAETWHACRRPNPWAYRDTCGRASSGCCPCSG